MEGMSDTTNKAAEQPQVHSNADELADGRLSAPSAVRNVGPILAAMQPYVPPEGGALEIASGTGQHVAAFAKQFPGVTWQPTDLAPDRLLSIDAWATAAAAGNILPATRLDAGVPDWDMGSFDYVTVSNLLHLVSNDTALNVIAGAARALRPGGHLFVYGPFRRDGAFRSAGDSSFHARIQAENPSAGYKDVTWMQETALANGLNPKAQIEMPANNLSLVWQKQGMNERGKV